MRTIGLVGGMTPESTLSYYQLLIRSARERLRGPDPLHNPVVIIYSLDLAKVVSLQRAAAPTRSLPARPDCETLREAGAEIGALTPTRPTCTSRRSSRDPAQLVSIVEATCAATAGLGLRRRCSWAPDHHGEPDVPARLDTAGIEVLTPDEEEGLVDQTIYTELAVASVGPRCVKGCSHCAGRRSEPARTA